MVLRVESHYGTSFNHNALNVECSVECVISKRKQKMFFSILKNAKMLIGLGLGNCRTKYGHSHLKVVRLENFRCRCRDKPR